MVIYKPKNLKATAETSRIRSRICNPLVQIPGSGTIQIRNTEINKKKLNNDKKTTDETQKENEKKLL
jgi:hypothetical protein